MKRPSKLILKCSVLSLLFTINLFACTSEGVESSKTSNSLDNRKECEYNGKKLYVGPKGGCFYYTDNGNKRYVNKNYCANCK